MKPFTSLHRSLAAFSFSLIALGSFALWLLNRPASDTLAGLVPRDAAAYVHVFLRPSTQERVDIESLLERLGSEDAGADVTDALEGLTRPLLRGSGLGFERDIRPWLGTQAAWFSLEDATEQAVLLATDDPDAAEDALLLYAAAHDDLEVEVLDDAVAIGTEGAMVRVRDPLAEDHRLDDEPGFQRLQDLLPDHRMLGAYLTTLHEEAAGFAISVRPDGLQVDGFGRGSESLVRAALGQRAGPVDLMTANPGWADLALDVLEGEAPAGLRLSGIVARPSEEAAALLGPGITPRIELHVGRALELAEPLGLLDSRTGAGPPVWLDRIDRVIVGTSTDGDRRHERIFIGVK